MSRENPLAGVVLSSGLSPGKALAALAVLGAVAAWPAQALPSECEMQLASTSSTGTKGNGESRTAFVSATGNWVSFVSRATNLHPADTDVVRDVYLKDLIEGDVFLMSVTKDGAKADADCTWPVVSADAKRVAFSSKATTLDSRTSGQAEQVYVKAITGDLWLASATSAGIKGDGDSLNPSISRDGTKVAFDTEATNFDPLDTTDTQDTYVKDLATGTLTLASTSSSGFKSNGCSDEPSLSADGTKVAFQSLATVLDPADPDTKWDIYVKDLATGRCVLASTSASGEKGNGNSKAPRLSADGRLVAFQSTSTNLHPQDTDPGLDVYVKDLVTGRIHLASTSSTGQKGSGDSYRAWLSGDGIKVGFQSEATNLDPADEDVTTDVYVKDLVTGELLLVSTSFDGTNGNGDSVYPSLSEDGSSVAFHSKATNLLPTADGDSVEDVYVKKLGRRTLALGSEVPLELSPATPQVSLCFKAPPGKAILLTLEDSDPDDANVVYVRWGAPASPSEFDLASDFRFQSEQRLVIPFTRDETAYVLVQSNSFGGDASRMTILAEVVDIAIERTSATQAGEGTEELSMVVDGAGFDEETTFFLKHVTTGEMVPALETIVESRERAEVTFGLAAADRGQYTLVATRPGLEPAVLESALQVLPERIGPRLEVNVNVPGCNRYNRVSELTVSYANVGDEEMDAPLLKIEAPLGAEMRLEGDEEFDEANPRILHEIQALGVHPGGVAGKLPPGGSGEIRVIFRTTNCTPVGADDCEFSFRVHAFTPGRDSFMGWDKLVPPEGMTEDDWKAAWPALSAHMGGTWQEYAGALADLATRLSRRGVAAYSVRELFRFAVREALGRPSAAVTGSVRLQESFAPLPECTVRASSFTATGKCIASEALADAGGRFVLDWLENGAKYEVSVLGYDVGPVKVSMPPQGDLYPEVELEATWEGGGGTTKTCFNRQEAGLPEEPLVPPAELFSLAAEASAFLFSAWDPNEKKGPLGLQVQGKRLISPEKSVEYTILFENQSAATAAAQTVVITDQLHEDLDWTTFWMGACWIGGNDKQQISFRSGSPDNLGKSGSSPGTQPYEGSQAMTILQDWKGQLFEHVVNVQYHLDLETGLVEWIIKTPTANPKERMEGCLLPNDPSGLKQGEGRLTFSVTPKKSAKEGSDISNDAIIKFDELPAVKTEAWRNVISHFAPPALAPQNPHPEDGEKEVAANIVLRWDEVKEAESYEVRIWRQEGGKEVQVFFADKVREAYFEPPEGTLVWETEHHWQVTAKNRYGSKTGDKWAFSTMEDPPDLPAPTDPVPPDRETDVPVPPPEFSWKVPVVDPNQEVESCILYVWAEDEKVPEIGDATAQGFEATELEGDLPKEIYQGMTYHWKVVVVNPGGELTEGPTWTFKTEEARFLRGDSNADGTVNIADPIFTLGYLFLGTQAPICGKSADATADDNVDISDAISTLYFLFLGGRRMPPPFPECGNDSTGKKVTCKTQPAGCRKAP